LNNYSNIITELFREQEFHRSELKNSSRLAKIKPQENRRHYQIGYGITPELSGVNEEI